MLRLWHGYALGLNLFIIIVQLLRSWNGLVFLSMPTISGSCSLCCSMNWIISCMVRETGRRWTSDSTLSCSTSFLAACRFDIVAMVTVVWQNDRRWKFSLWLVFYLLPCHFVLGACGIDPSLLWEDTWYQSPNHKVGTWTWNEDTQHSLLLNNIHIQTQTTEKENVHSGVRNYPIELLLFLQVWNSFAKRVIILLGFYCWSKN